MECEMLLTLKEAAFLEKKSWEAINKNARRGKLEAIKIETDARCGFEYRIPLTALSPKAQKRYFSELAAAHEATYIIAEDKDKEKEQKRQTSMEYLTAKQREDAVYWEIIIKEWQEYISVAPKGKTELTKMFIEDFNSRNERKISIRTLYEKYKIFKEYGVAGLADGRMSHEKKGRRIDERLWSGFLQWYLDENRLSVSYIYNTLKDWVRLENLDIKLPSEATMRRAAEEIPVPVLKYFRYGSKVFEDECLPYVRRIYENIESNEYWSADYHTLDLMVRDDITGEVYRPHIVTWIDVRSRKVLAVRMTKTANSYGVILSFKDAVAIYGLPFNVYLDNGREFLVSDFGGRGKRKTSSNAFYGTGILERLGIKMINAKVKNGKAKVIERSYKQTTSEFSKLFITYCGNRPGNRPERHNKVLKKESNIPLASEVKEDLENYFFGHYNMYISQAEGLNGITPNECYAKNLIQKRSVTEDQLNLMMLRNARLQKVIREGVHITVSGKKIWYFDADFVKVYMGQSVYVRYDPDKLGSVRVYDEHEVFMAVLEIMPTGGYDMEADIDAIKYVNTSKKKIENAVKAFLENQKEIMEMPGMRDVVMSIAKENRENDEMEYEAAVITANFGYEKTEAEYKEAVGGGSIIDWDKMLNSERRK